MRIFIYHNRERADAMTDFTRIQNRFTGYTAKDCACVYCLYHVPQKRGHCSLKRCCCEAERMEAAKRERKNDKMWRKFSQERK